MTEGELRPDSGAERIAAPVADAVRPTARASSPAALLRQLGLKPRRGLSQSFLTDVGVTRQIAAAAALGPDDQVLEIGPGLGILTQALAQKAGRVVAFELDRDLAAALPRLVPANVEIVQGDALTLDPHQYFTGPFKLVANLPYQITSPFLFRYLALRPGPTVQVLMVQREVAERIAAGPGSRSYLAVAVQSAAQPRLVRLVPPGAFHPRPRVESAVVRLDPLPEPLVSPEQRQPFLDLVRAGFGQPRKQLLNSLHQGLTEQARSRDAWSRAEVRTLLDQAGIASERRPQELELPEWRTLFEAFQAFRPERDDAQPDEPHVQPRSGGRGRSWRLSANAKLNLGLEILGRRPDGFHEIVSVTQQISLADAVEYTPGGPFAVEMVPPLVDAGENLAGRAATILADAMGTAPSGRLTIRKRIPLAAGLGGGSSDAAASLRLLDRRWGAGLAADRLSEIGATLGSDVPLFLSGATSLIRGRGEIVEPLQGPPTFWVVLVTPEVSPPDKTRALYRALAPADLTDGSATLALAEQIRAGRPVQAGLLVNGFDTAADTVYPGHPELRTQLAELVGAAVHLTGTGPTLFALFAAPESARQAARAARRAGLPAIMAHSTAGRPQIRASKGALAR